VARNAETNATRISLFAILAGAVIVSDVVVDLLLELLTNDTAIL